MNPVIQHGRTVYKIQKKPESETLARIVRNLREAFRNLGTVRTIMRDG